MVGGGGFTCAKRMSTEFSFCWSRSYQSCLSLANCKFPVAADGKLMDLTGFFCDTSKAGSFPKVPAGDWNQVVFNVPSSPDHSMKSEWAPAGECEAGASSSSIWFFNLIIRADRLGLDHQHLIKWTLTTWKSLSIIIACNAVILWLRLRYEQHKQFEEKNPYCPSLSLSKRKTTLPFISAFMSCDPISSICLYLGKNK